MSAQWTAQQVWESGEAFSVCSTICSDFIPERGEGSYVFGEFALDGKRAKVLDFSSGYSTAPLGYNHPVLIKAMVDQITTSGLIQFPANDWHNRWSVQLKQKLCEIAPVPQPSKVFLCNSGTEAIETAIKLCDARRLKQRENRPKLLSLQGSFHGRTAGALSILNRKSLYTEGFHKSHISDILPFPHVYDPTSIEKFEHALDCVANPQFINACFVELIQGEGGVRVINKKSVQRLARFCQDNDIYLVVDEIQTGLMRAGTMFACEQFGIRPDIICLAKALGAGNALGAVIANDQFDFVYGQHSNTFGGTPSYCAASLALIDLLEKMDEQAYKEKVALMAGVFPEGLGMMRRLALTNIQEPITLVSRKIMHDHLIIVIPAGNNVLRIMPPLNIEFNDLLRGIDIIDSATKDLR